MDVEGGRADALAAASEARVADVESMVAAECVWGGAPPPPAGAMAPPPSSMQDRRWLTGLSAAEKAQAALLRMRAAPGDGAVTATATAAVQSATAQWVGLPQVERMQRLSAYVSELRAACAAEKAAGDQRGRGRDVVQSGPGATGSRSRSASAEGSSASTHDLD